MDIERIILDYFERDPHILSITLFGSFARKAENADSDVDVALLWKREHVPDNEFRFSRFFGSFEPIFDSNLGG